MSHGIAKNKWNTSLFAIQAKMVGKYGVVGIIFYTDPQDFTEHGSTEVYPESWWLPPSGVHRGSLSLSDGDPLTPGYPSIGKQRPLYRVTTKFPPQNSRIFQGSFHDFHGCLNLM